MPRILVTGTFDHLHPGHLFLLHEARKRGQLVVIVGRDSTVEHIKGRRALQNETQRRQAIQDAFPDAEVTVGDSEDFLAPVLRLKPDLILLGYDQQLPPGVGMEDLPCNVERLKAFEPHIHKSSLRRAGQ